MQASGDYSLSNSSLLENGTADGLLSLFSGAGGLDCGFEAAGFRVSAAFDLRADAIASYNHNRKGLDKTGRVGNVAELTLEKLDEIVGHRFSPSGVIGGPPCQSFSTATHSADDDPRHDLPLRFAELVAALNRRSPVDFFVMENVPGLLKPKHAARLADFRKRFEGAGFMVTQAVLNASDFGVPQNRPRLIMVGVNRAIFPGRSWIPPTPTVEQAKTVEDAIKGLPEPTYWTRGLGRADMPHHVNHWCMTPKSVSFSTKGRLAPGTARGRSFRTLAWSAPSYTVAYPNIVAPLTQLYRTLAGDAFAPSPAKGPYESTDDYESRIVAFRAAKSDALSGRLRNQTYAIVLGTFRLEGMESIEAFSPTSPDTVAYDPNSSALSPVRDSSLRWASDPQLERVETMVFGQMNPTTLAITEARRERTRAFVENENAISFRSLPPMAATDIRDRHRGLMFVVVGRLNRLTREEGGERVISIKADHVELRDVCSNEVLWRQGVD